MCFTQSRSSQNTFFSCVSLVMDGNRVLQGKRTKQENNNPLDLYLCNLSRSSLPPQQADTYRSLTDQSSLFLQPVDAEALGDSLVVEHDVRSPDVVTGHVKHLNPSILLGVPLQLVVTPVLLHPQVGRHDLVLQILKQ